MAETAAAAASYRSRPDSFCPEDWSSSVLVRFRLFIGSFAPLFGILAIRFQELALQGACAAIAAWGLVDMWRITRRLVVRLTPSSYTIADVDDRGGEVAGYVAAYLLPFVTVPEPGPRDLAAYGLFLAVIGLIYTRSRMAQINPTLYVLGRRVVFLQMEGGWKRFAIVKRIPAPGDDIVAVHLREEVLVAVEPLQLTSD